MQGRRVDRIEEQLRMEVSEIIEREVQDPRIGLVSVTRVKISPDLRYAHIYISVLGGDDQRKKALLGLRSAAGYVRKSLGQRLHHLKRIPELMFEYDDAIEQEIRLEELFDRIKTDPK